jgi:hypothetical protein
MKALQVTSGLGALALLILIPLEADYNFKMDLLCFQLLLLIIFLSASHIVGIQKKSNNGKK